MRAHPFQDGDIHLFWTHLDQLLGRAPGFKDGDDLCSLTSSPFYLIFIFLSVRRDMVLLGVLLIPLLSNQDAGGLPASDGMEKAPFRWEKRAVGMASQAASIAVSCHEE